MIKAGALILREAAVIKAGALILSGGFLDEVGAEAISDLSGHAADILLF